MKVLVACEESQAVCKSFRQKGHEAYSCDIQYCSGGNPEWHIKCDVLKVLNPFINGIEFHTCDNKYHRVIKWDLIIAHPPYTYLTVAGNRWFNVERYGEKALNRIADRAEAAEFFMQIWHAYCEKVIIENPIGYMNTYFRKPDQIIHPYYFAESEDDENCERKATCLWMRGVEPLKYEVKYIPRVVYSKNGKGSNPYWLINTLHLPSYERTKLRSKTYPGIAKAMSEQWG